MKVMLLGCASSSIYSLRKEIIQEIMKAGIITIISVPEGMHYKDLEQISSLVIQTEIDRRGTNIWNDLKLLHSYYRIIKENKPDCILTYTIKCNLYGGIISYLLDIPYIMNVTGLGSSLKKSKFIKNTVLTMFRYVVKHSYCVFFQNIDNKRLFNDLHIHGNFELIIPGSGVNLQLNKLEKYPEDNGKIIFLFVARIMHEKGIDVLVKAVSILRSEYKNIELHVVGPYEENYRDKIHTWEKNDLIIYHGEQENVHPFMRECHVLIHPSFYLEGMSNVCLEAAATGRPVITTNMAGCRDTVDNGKTGFICQPNNIDSLVLNIKKFLVLPYKQKIEMGLAGRKKMEIEFDRKIIIDNYMKEIRRVGGESSESYL